MAYNSDGYIMIDFTEVDFRRTNQTIEGLYKRCVDVIGTNKFILVINANGRTPLPATCSFTNNQYVIDTCIYMFAISSNDNLFIRRNDVPASDIIDDSSISVDKTWSSNKIDTELDTKADTSALAEYQPLLTAGTNINIDENNVISSTGGAVIDDSIIVNNKVWSSLNTVEQLAPIDTIINNPVEFNTSLALPLIACKVSISATQEGSGDPNPIDNIRNIHGFSEVNVTANNVVHNIQLGEEVYGGSYNSVTGDKKKTINSKLYNGSENWTQVTISGNKYFQYRREEIPSGANFISNMIKKSGAGSANYIGYIGGSFVNVRFTEGTTLEEFKSILSNDNLQIVYDMTEPIESNIGATPISTNIGNNTITTDGDILTVSYRHLPIDLI